MLRLGGWVRTSSVNPENYGPSASPAMGPGVPRMATAAITQGFGWTTRGAGTPFTESLSPSHVPGWLVTPAQSCAMDPVLRDRLGHRETHGTRNHAGCGPPTKDPESLPCFSARPDSGQTAGRLEEASVGVEGRAGFAKGTEGRGRGREEGESERRPGGGGPAHPGAAQSHGAAGQRSGLGSGGAVVVREVGGLTPFSPAEVPGVRLGEGFGDPWLGRARQVQGHD